MKKRRVKTKVHMKGIHSLHGDMRDQYWKIMSHGFRTICDLAGKGQSANPGD